MITPIPESRVRLLWLLAVVWLSLVSVLLLVNHVALSRLRKDAHASVQRTELMTLLDSLGALEQQLSAMKHQPAPVSQSSFTSARQSLDERLVRVEQLLANTAAASDFTRLQDRITAIEAGLAKARKAPSLAPPRAPVADQPPLLAPPFAVLGTELRGGQQFLSIAPVGTHALSQVRVLRPGEAEANWTLESLEGHAAQFRIDGRLQRIEVP